MSHPLLLEIQRFAVGKNNYHREEVPEITLQFVKSGLKLLEELPVLRDSIFDYFSLIFEVAIGNHIKNEKMQQLSPVNEKPIMMIKDGLEKLITEQAWAATYISQWSLSRLIKPSLEYAKILNLDFKGACSLWLNCGGTRTLLDLCGLCFNKFDDTEMKRFIYDLENVFADNRPNFDWCVAHLSSLFPIKFISNLLRMPSMFTPAFISSTVTVLEYLSSTSERSLKHLLKEIVDEALDADKNDLKSKDYIPNLIQLSSKSEKYAQATLNVFLDYMEQKNSNNIIDKLQRQVKLRPLDYHPDKLHHILPELILQTKENGTKLLLMITETFDSNAWCVELVELVVAELESMILNGKTCSLFDDIRKETSWKYLWESCMSKKRMTQQTAIRIILAATNDKNSILYFKTIEELIMKNTIVSPWIFDGLIRLLDGPQGINDPPDVSVAISHIVQRLAIDVKYHTHQNQCYFMLRNLVELMKIEASGQCQYLKRGIITSALQSSLRMLTSIWEILLTKIMNDVEIVVIAKSVSEDYSLKKIKTEKDEAMEIADLEEDTTFDRKHQIHMMANLLDCLNMSNGVINMSEVIRLEKFTVKYFFWCLTETDEITRTSHASRCFSLFTKQCSDRKGVRAAALRDLLEGALFIYGNLLGSPRQSTRSNERSIIDAVKEESLLKLNQKQGISLCGSRSSILHSGTIGSGIAKVSQVWVPDALNNDVKTLFVKAIVACCHDAETDENENNLIDGLCCLSQILVELISTDVMYNGILWPVEEDFTKITIERDLHIRRTFKNCPVLWSILGLLAQHRKGMALWGNCSVFLRALCASVMHHWRAKSTETMSGSNSELMFFTVKLLELLALAQLLPSPLNYLHIVVPYLEPLEIAYVLKECVWNYMVINGGNFFHSEDFLKQPVEPAAEQFIDPLRNTMQKNLGQLGNLYYEMFILPQQIKN